MNLKRTLIVLSFLGMCGCGQITKLLSDLIPKDSDNPTSPGTPTATPSPTPQPPVINITTRSLGHDLLGAMHPKFDYQAAARAIATGSPLGFLDHTFGDAIAGVEYLIEHVRPRYVRVHLFNTVCVRNNNCGHYEPGAKHSVGSLNYALERNDGALLLYTRGRTAIWKSLSEKYPNTTFLVSPALEHNLSPAAYRILADAVKSVWADVQLVNSPLSGNGERYLGSILEAHGQSPPQTEISSLDGAELMDVDTQGWLGRTAGNKLTFRWSRGYNLRDQAEKFTDPRARTKSPTPAMFEMYEHATDAIEPPSQVAFPCTAISEAVIYKPLSEDKGTGDGRANKPVLIAELGKGDVQLVAANGAEVGKLKYYGQFTDKKRGRYYSGMPGGSNKHGYEFQQAALMVAKSPYVYARGNGRCIGPFVPGRRQGSYR